MNDSAFLPELLALRPDLVQRFLRLRCERAEAEDLTQDTLLRGVRSLSTYRPEASMKPWVMGIAHNVHRQHRRAAQRREKAILAEPDAGAEPFAWDIPPDVSAQLSQMRERLCAAVDVMPDRLFEVFFLVYLEEHTLDEAGRELGISKDAVKMRALRVRKYLQKELRDFRDAYRGALPPMLPSGPVALLVQRFAPMLGHVASVIMAALLLLPLPRPEAPMSACVGVAAEVHASAAKLSAASVVALDEPAAPALPEAVPLVAPTSAPEPPSNPRPKRKAITIKRPSTLLVAPP
ncbi:RNA polymerase sigma factor [Polyangium sp. 6x1]|uniref:RNA polymerase sigma factor n=1 Tax=Polyangium sp. 6x1 TaxID=3042689 RepID=UPI0024823AB5|nr:RNA polymerase sigma factor [Polyangium sp. 6x1]MDI1449669.1 RNA polymerase sigma factor [Polyangium sp. 6x1]